MDHLSRDDIIAVAMSGGIDSSVTALLLKKRKMNIFGVFLRLFKDSSRTKNNERAVAEVCRELDINLHILDIQDLFYKEIIFPFCKEYIKGRTPNPCIECNFKIKFGILLKRTKEIGATKIATGHYAKVVYESDMWVLKKGIDKKKDQSYFLYRLGQEQLKSIIMPMGYMYKSRTKVLSAKFSCLHKKKESQEVCFIPGDYRKFILQNCGIACTPGNIVDKNGIVIGRHNGIINYTIGQRKGIGIADSSPLYVIGIDKDRNEIVAGKSEDILTTSIQARILNWILSGESGAKYRLRAKIRYQHEPEYAKIRFIREDTAIIVFDRPQRAVAPGQSIVFYRYNTVIGGGIIQSSNPEEENE